MKGYGQLFCMLLGTLGGCTHMFSGPATGVSIKSEILFTYEDGKPAVGQTVYVVETIGTGHRTTVVTNTDEHGGVVLDGFFCTPMYVAADGGAVAINAAKLKALYAVTIRNDRVPNLERSFGPPIPDPVFKQPHLHKSCG